MIARIPHLPVLALITFRPEFQPPWTGQAHVTLLSLNRLGREECEALVESLLADQALSSEVVAEIVERADGIPLFVEELTNAVLEAAGRSSRTAGGLPPVSSPAVAIPATLHASLTARLDRLCPAAKEIAQIGAAIGREFSYELLGAVAQRPDDAVQSALGQLVDGCLVFCRGAPPQATYWFKHALVQDASYDTLLRSQRQILHARIALVLAERFPDSADRQPELLAHHYARAGLIEQAITSWIRAGQASLARSAMIEAVAQLRKGLNLLPSLPDGPARWQQELDLQSVLGAALVASKGNSAPEAGQAYARARELCDRLGDTAARIPVLSGLSTYHQTRGEYAAMQQIAEELLRLGQDQDVQAGYVVGNRSMGLYLHQVGEFAAAREHFERVLSLYSPEAHHSLASVAAYDMQAVALSYLSLDLFILGHPEEARSWSRQALDWSRQLHHPHNLAFALNYAALLRLLERTEASAKDLLDELTSVAAEHRFPVWLAQASIMRGFVLAAQGDAAEGLALARQGVVDRAATGACWNETFFLDLLALTCERAAEAEEALAIRAAALAAASRTGERWYEAELYRHRGECVMAAGNMNPSEAEACFRQAVTLAQRQGARSWELRAALRLAQLWCDQGRPTAARDLLAPAFGRFAEGLETPDLNDAKRLLDHLR